MQSRLLCVIFALLGGAMSVASHAADPVAAPAADPAAAPAERFMAVYALDFHFQESYSVMSESTYLTRFKEVKAEPALLARAKQSARNAWQAEESERIAKLREQVLQQPQQQQNANAANNYLQSALLKRRPFPKLEINMTPELRCVGTFASEPEAQERCKQLEGQQEAKKKEEGVKAQTLVRLEDKQIGGLAKPTGKSKGHAAVAKNDSQSPADAGKATAMFEKALEQLKEPQEEKKLTLEAPTIEKGMLDSRKNVKALSN